MGDYFVASSAVVQPVEGGESVIRPTCFFYSKHGVYWAKQDVHDEREYQPFNVKTIKAFDGKMYVEKFSNSDLYAFNLSDLDATMPKSDIYIQLNGEILGFDTPPIMDADRILVLVRFI